MAKKVIFKNKNVMVIKVSGKKYRPGVFQFETKSHYIILKGKNNIGSFDNKLEALKFAKAYMRAH